MAANAIDQTRRMLSLVTYLRERPGARVEDVARAFGITEDELVSDLDVLPMCGTSFRGGDLLDIDTDGERIWWHNPRTMPPSRCGWPPTRRPRCWSPPAPWPPCPDCARATGEALLRATAKLEAAAGEAAGASSRLSVTFESEGGVFADVDRAISERRRLWMRYYSPARDEVTEREVDPIRLFSRRPHLHGGLVPPLRGAPHLPARPGRRDQAARRAVRAARDRAAGPVGGAGAARGRGPGGRRRGRARRPLGRRVLPARQRGGAARRRPADHPAHARPGVAAAARRCGSGRDGRIVSPQDLADSARRAAREALAAYDGARR